MKDFWKMIVASMMLNFIIAFFTPLLSIFIQGVGEKNVFVIGIAWGTVFLTEAFVSVYFGRLADKYGRRKFLIIGNLIYCVIPFAYIFVSNISQIIFLEFISGIGLGMNTPAFFALFAEKMKQGKRGIGYGIWNSTVTLVTGIGAIVGAFIAQILGFQTMFIIMGIIQIVQTILIASVKE